MFNYFGKVRINGELIVCRQESVISVVSALSACIRRKLTIRKHKIATVFCNKDFTEMEYLLSHLMVVEGSNI